MLTVSYARSLRFATLAQVRRAKPEKVGKGRQRVQAESPGAAVRELMQIVS